MSISLDCTLLCASGVAYGVCKDGSFKPWEPYYQAVGYADTPKQIVGGVENINAVVVGATSDAVIVACRGTLAPEVSAPNILDWIQDLMASPVADVNYPGKVHDGFRGAVETVWPGVLAEVKALNPDGTMPIYVTGHSKGGPLASLIAWRLHSEGMKPDQVITFASPLVGDTDFARSYNEVFEQVRYENYLDLVPLLPPTRLGDTLMAQLVSFWPALSDVFKDAARWNYEAVGSLQYIEADHSLTSDYPGLIEIRVAEIIAQLTDPSKIIDAHSHTCGGGYMGGACPGAPCNGGSGDPAPCPS